MKNELTPQQMGKQICQLRKKKGWSQEELAAKIGVLEDLGTQKFGSIGKNFIGGLVFGVAAFKYQKRIQVQPKNRFRGGDGF